MINQTAKYLENTAKELGLTIKIPRPSPTTRRVCSTTNSLIGIALIGTGTILKKPSLIAIGALGVVGAALLALDK